MCDISVLVQGPPNIVSLEKLDDYTKHGHVVVSCWNDDVPSVPDHVKLTANPKPPKKYYAHAAGHTFSYQVHSILNGLRAVDTKYVIRTRSDEFYNLGPFVEKYDRRDDVVLCGNIFFKPWSAYGFHMGDHLFMARTSVLLTAYAALAKHVDYYNNKGRPEQSSSFAILDAFQAPRTRESFCKHFDVMDINELKPFRARWNGWNVDYDNEFGDKSVITSMEQL